MRRMWRRYEEIVLGALEKPRVYLVNVGIGLALFGCGFAGSWWWMPLIWLAFIAANLVGYRRYRKAARERARAAVDEP
jgi:hypothetical protein